MPSLRDTQRAFCAAIVSGGADGMRELVREDGIAAEQRMQIYRNNSDAGSLDDAASHIPGRRAPGRGRVVSRKA